MPRYLSRLMLILGVLMLPGTGFAQSASPSATRSVREWVTCDGRTDDLKGLTKAFAAAANKAFTLSVDCPVFFHIGEDITRPIFIGNGTHVRFSGAGEFIADNSMIPAFVIANSSDIALSGWRVKYTGGARLDWAKPAGYTQNGRFIAQEGQKIYAQPSFAFNNITLTQWLKAHRGVVFVNTVSPWAGPGNAGAMFFIIGSSHDLSFIDFRAYVTKGAPGSRFIPIVFSSVPGVRDNVTVSKPDPITSERFAVPSRIRFSDIDLDGTYLGWQGRFQDTEILKVRSRRYGDLQDDKGGSSGGMLKWFPPPHLIYINYLPEQTGLEVRNVHIADVVDEGLRAGVARDKEAVVSGYANSLKIGGYNVRVERYSSQRPDGLLDVLTCDDMVLSDLEATYDSAFLNNLYPGIRFPALEPGYRNLTLKNVRLTDKAAVTLKEPIGGSWLKSNNHIVFYNVSVSLNRWGGAGQLGNPVFGGSGHDAPVKYNVTAKP